MIELITGQTGLVKPEEVFKRPGGPGWMQFIVVDLQTILQKFEREAPPRESAGFVSSFTAEPVG